MLAKKQPKKQIGDDNMSLYDDLQARLRRARAIDSNAFDEIAKKAGVPKSTLGVVADNQGIPTQVELEAIEKALDALSY